MAAEGATVILGCHTFLNRFFTQTNWGGQILANLVITCYISPLVRFAGYFYVTEHPQGS